VTAGDDGFVRAILAEPEDETARLVYADWLDEHHQPGRAEFLRRESEWFGLPHRSPPKVELGHRLDAMRAGLDPEWLARVDRTDRFTVFWAERICENARRHGREGQPLLFLRNEANNHTTDFTWLKPRVGSFLYPIRVHASRVHVIARMRVCQVTTVGAFLERHPELTQQVGTWGLTGPLLAGDAGTPIRFDNPVPPHVVGRWSSRSGSKERKLKHVQDGQVKHNAVLQGVYRLSHRTAFDLEALV
jgi:uncharacterized protein (TIGR02996 family)